MNKKKLIGIIAACGMGAIAVQAATTSNHESPVKGLLPRQTIVEDLPEQKVVETLPKQTRYAVVVVDMQGDFLRFVSQHEMKEELPYYISLLKSAQRNNVLIFFLESEGMGKTIGDLTDILPTSDYEIIAKSRGNGFLGTDLNERLKERGVHSIIFAGIYASYCVKQTAGGALNNGYAILTSPEIIADVNWEVDLNESKEWYKENGKWFENYGELEQLIGSL